MNNVWVVGQLASHPLDQPWEDAALAERYIKVLEQMGLPLHVKVMTTEEHDQWRIERQLQEVSDEIQEDETTE